ncbi:MAG: hypothetical protein Q8M51_03890 [Polaromonas sp.]|uniref:hypothetical protein n=1 Tax=Polaromonas sp. TaxID=1869339 RepID=UPI0027317555|nr:hypothetical protein [Polaromonas sp.]MDP1739515.1 hypothetical protein [Polaromonas sp.]MDP1953083.1 hypothetical protein [Polaromonas sp.]MDP3354987.1 hypothetical protein [Polaromonas sp.]MDP3750308.1 hypothetical protein [Polaromonas sp.]
MKDDLMLSVVTGPATPLPTEMPPPVMPPLPEVPPEVVDLPPDQPALPVREPGKVVPMQA